MAKAWSGRERRRHKRAPLQFIITFNIYEPTRVRILAGEQEYYGMMLDISENGMAIKAKCTIGVSTFLTIRMVLVDLSMREKSEQLKETEALGQVCNSMLLGKGLYRLGINFVRINKEDKRIIARFVRQASR